MSIRIFYDEVSYRYKGWLKLKGVLNEIIFRENFVPGDISIVISTDERVRAINIEFLEHDYFTDVITFNYNTGKEINGEVYISYDTVRMNSVNYNVSLNNEMSRVIIHGVLHLTGFDDKSAEEKSVMRREEEGWLKKLEVEK